MSSLPPSAPRGRSNRPASSRLIESLEQRRLLSVTWEIVDIGSTFQEGGVLTFGAIPSEGVDISDYEFDWDVTLDGNELIDSDTSQLTADAFSAIAPNQGSLDVLSG